MEKRFLGVDAPQRNCRDVACYVSGRRQIFGRNQNEDSVNQRKSAKALSRAGFAKIFTNRRQAVSRGSRVPAKEIGQNCPLAHLTRPCDGKTAPTLLHPPVNHLHLIENSEDTIPRFLLTLKIERVKT
jgi:hypothetical protein